LDVQPDRDGTKNEGNVKKNILLREKRQKNNPNLLALFAFYRYLFIIGSVWG